MLWLRRIAMLISCRRFDLLRELSPTHFAFTFSSSIHENVNFTCIVNWNQYSLREFCYCFSSIELTFESFVWMKFHATKTMTMKIDIGIDRFVFCNHQTQTPTRTYFYIYNVFYFCSSARNHSHMTLFFPQCFGKASGSLAQNDLGVVHLHRLKTNVAWETTKTLFSFQFD